MSVLERWQKASVTASNPAWPRDGAWKGLGPLYHEVDARPMRLGESSMVATQGGTQIEEKTQSLWPRGTKDAHPQAELCF